MGGRVPIDFDRGGAMEPCECCARPERPPSGPAVPPCSSSTTPSSPRLDEVRDRIRDRTPHAPPPHLCGLECRMRRDTWICEVFSRLTQKSLDRRILALDAEIAMLDRHNAPLARSTLPICSLSKAVGVARAAELEGLGVRESRPAAAPKASFAMLSGACPLHRIERKNSCRHRLNRHGDRQANSALHMIVLCRMRTDQRTRSYVERRTERGAVQTRGHALSEALRGPRWASPTSLHSPRAKLRWPPAGSRRAVGIPSLRES